MLGKTRYIALAALLAAGALLGDAVDVTFNAALTNGTGWVYSETILPSSEGGEHHYFRTIGSCIASPAFGFNITSVTIRLSCSSTSPTRHLQIGPTADDGQRTAAVAKKDTPESQVFLFDPAAAMRSLAIALKGSGNTGNWHVYSATIAGVARIAPPTGLWATEINGTRVALAWTNPEGAVSNRIEAAEVVRRAAEGTTLAAYDFSEYSNGGGNPQEITDGFTNATPAFAGSARVYLPTNTAGVIQFSTGKEQGLLRYDFSALGATLGEDADVALLLSAQKHPTDTSSEWKGLTVLQLGDADAVLRTTDLDLTFDFPAAPVAVPLAHARDTRAILLTPSDAASGGRRVLVDYLAFVRGYAPARVETNVVKSVAVAASAPSAGAATLRGLAPHADYLVVVTALDAEGGESAPSAPLAVATGSAQAPFTVRIQ